MARARYQPLPAPAPAVATIQVLYLFIEHARHQRKPLWNVAREDMLLIEGLLFLCEHRLDLPYWPRAYVSDSSDYGYALCETWASEEELREAGKYRERWRFLDVPDSDAVKHLTAGEMDFRGGLLALGGGDPAELPGGLADPALRPGAPAGVGTSTAFATWSTSTASGSSSPVAAARCPAPTLWHT